MANTEKKCPKFCSFALSHKLPIMFKCIIIVYFKFQFFKCLCVDVRFTN